MDTESYGVLLAISVNFIDQLWQFTLPVVVPFGVWLGADLEVIALFTTFRGIGGVLSNLWLPRFADGKGVPRHRAAVLLSLVGCTIGYIIQGFASEFAHLPVGSIIFIVGRFVVGLMSGMTPVICAYLTALCRDDVDLLRWRFTALQATNSSIGVALAPIAGALSFFGLELPFYACAVLSFILLVMCCISFREATDALAHAGKAPSSAAPKVSAESANEKEGNPYCNPIVMMHCFCMMCIVMMVGGQMLLLPKLLAEPGFGLQGATVKVTQQQVANAMGLINVPSAALTLFSNTFLFLPVTRKLGDAPVVAIFGIILTSALCSLGMVTSHIWLIAAIMALNGLSMGLVFPVVGPMFTKYYKFAFPTQQATAQAVGNVGVSISMLVSQVVIAGIYTRFGRQAAWAFCGAGGSAFAATILAAHFLISRRVKPRLHPGQEALLSVLDPGKDADVFIEDACGRFRTVLQARKEQLWNGSVQSVYDSWLEAPPVLPVLDDTVKMDSDAYMEQIHELMLKHCPSASAEAFQRKFLLTFQDGRIPDQFVGPLVTDGK